MRFVRLAGSVLLAVPYFASAQVADSSSDSVQSGTQSSPPSKPSVPVVAPAQDDQATLTEVVVTGVARQSERLDASVSVSSLGADVVTELAPRNTAEVLRNLPGMRVEASGGEGNANIAIRGLPLGSGGSKFLQLQEEGLPVLEFGDIIFGNADIFVRPDYSLSRIESVRGGSASTFASNSPGGIINFISNTGEKAGSAFQLSSGLDYREYRTDFANGGPITDATRYQVSGFYRLGDGPRDVGYNAMKGGQIKANFTTEFNGGYIRFYGKYLNDRGISYMPNPVRVTGTESDPKYVNLPGFSINQDTLQSRYIDDMATLDGSNQPSVRHISDGMHPLVKSLGVEAQFSVMEGWNIVERFRYADISGNFVSPFPADVGDAQTVANGLAGAGATLYYASGPLSGQQVTSPATLGGNGQLASIVLFDVDLKKLDNLTNDIRISGDMSVGEGTLSLTGGLYKSRQYVGTDWLWTSFFQTVEGGGNSVLVDIRNAANVALTQDGVPGYSAYFFGNCCRRSYDVHYDTTAPFAQLGYEIGRFNFDASLREDYGRARGTIAENDLNGAASGVTTFDMNGDGLISAPEQFVAYKPIGGIAPVHYNYDYLSYSVGANYRLADNLSVFTRYSRGGRANADRLLFGPLIDTTTGNLVAGAKPYDFVRQSEAGVKWSRGGSALYATVFHANTEETNYLLSEQQFISRTFAASGLELEGSIQTGIFSLSAGATYTDAEIARDSTDATLRGMRPPRQAKFIYQATPRVDVGQWTVGANLIGTTDSYTHTPNQLKLPAYTQVNTFVSVRPLDSLTLSLNGNNIFNVKGMTEAEDTGMPVNGIARARSINGRTLSASVRYDF